MPGRHRGAERALRREQRAQSALPLAAEGEPEFRPPLAHRGDDLVQAEAMEHQPHPRPSRAQRDHGTRKQVGAEAAHHGDRQLAAMHPAHLLDQRRSAVMVGERAADMRDQHLARRRHPQSVRQTVEQRHAGLGLEREKLPVDRGGGDVQP
jgi:hypothetical protein